MMYDNGILGNLKKVSKPLTLKEALSRWSNDPVWHKLVANGYIQYYSWAVTVTDAGDKWLKEREVYRWLLKQRLEDSTDEEECKEIRKFALISSFPDIADAAINKIIFPFSLEDIDLPLTSSDVKMMKICEIADYLPLEYASWAEFIYDLDPEECDSILYDLRLGEDIFCEDDLVYNFQDEDAIFLCYRG